MGRTDIYGTIHININEYKYFSLANKTVYKIDHILGHKASLHNIRKLK